MNNTIPQVSLGELLTLERRPVKVLPDQQYAEIGIYSFGRGIFHKQPRSGLEVGDKDLFLIKEGDFILQITFAWEGAVGLASQAENEMYGSVRFPTFRVDEGRCYPPYLVNYFRTHSGREQLVRISPGSAGRNRVLSMSRIPEVHVPLPPLSEQCRIVARIDGLAVKIQEARGLRREAVAEASAFVSGLHLNLAQGRMLPLNQMVVLDECRETVEAGRQYPQVGVKGFGQGLFAKGAVSAFETTYKAFNRLYDGALVLSQVKGWEGAIAVCDKELAGWYVSPEYRTFRCIPSQAIPEYLAALVTTPWFWGQLKHMSRGLGGRRERTRPEQFLQMELPMPPIEQQQQAIKAFVKLNNIMHLQAETAVALDAMLPSVLDKAFKGEL
jgi:type I restriction enzyme S subunit